MPTALSLQAKQRLFADNVNIIISYPKIGYFQNCTNGVSASLNKRFKASELTLNFKKSSIMKFCVNTRNCINLNIN